MHERRERWRRSPGRAPRSIRLVALLPLSLAVLAGCAAERPHVDQDPPGAERAWRCEVERGETAVPWYDHEDGEWWVDGGSYFVVERSSRHPGAGRSHSGRAGAGGHATEEAALGQAAGECVADALRLLGSRGASFDDAYAAELRASAVTTLAQGDELAFPRMRIAGRVTERCEHLDAASATWRATVLGEYATSELRGDVNNALWESRKLEREAAILLDSSRSYFGEGRWFDGLIELARAERLLETAARPFREEGLAQEIDDLRQWALHAVSIEPDSSIDVLEIGERREAAIGFRCFYEWEGSTVPAVRLPVQFQPLGFEAVMANDHESDERGTAFCRILVAYGEVGGRAITPSIDAAVVEAAIGKSRSLGLSLRNGPPQQVFLVEGAHAVSVCLELTGARDQDAVQLRTGFERRMQSDGYVVEECGASIDVLVRASVAISAAAADEAWIGTAVIDASAFDQRSAEWIGETMIPVLKEAQTERDSEVLALKEAGRLLAAYLSRRILASGG